MWIDRTAPPDELRGLVENVISQTRELDRGLPTDPTPDALTKWFTSVIPDLFDPVADRNAVGEQAKLLYNIEGSGLSVNGYLTLGSYVDRRRGLELYSAAFGRVAAAQAISQIDVYRALRTEMQLRPEQQLACVSWNPAHVASSKPLYLYMAQVNPATIAGISVWREFHPIVWTEAIQWELVRPDLAGRNDWVG